MTDEGDLPSDRLRDRVEGRWWKLWFFLDADRTFVTGVILLAFFLAIQTAAMLYPPAEGMLRTTSSVDYVFQGFIAGTITGVTLVVTLNQLVLSRELGAVGEQRERMSGALRFREDAADVIDAPVSPARPSQFLRALIQVSDARARKLRRAVAEGTDLAAAVDALVDSITENAQHVSGTFDEAQFGTFDVLRSALDFNYSWKVFQARRIEGEYGDRLDETAAAALAALVEVLELFGLAREHFKTLYFRWELVNLSRDILWTALLALSVSLFMVAFFDPAAFTADPFGLEGVVLVVTVAATVAVSPFVILVSYVVRIATVAKHTLSIGPFILRETDAVEEVEWDQ